RHFTTGVTSVAGWWTTCAASVPAASSAGARAICRGSPHAAAHRHERTKTPDRPGRAMRPGQRAAREVPGRSKTRSAGGEHLRDRIHQAAFLAGDGAVGAGDRLQVLEDLRVLFGGHRGRERLGALERALELLARRAQAL